MVHLWKIVWQFFKRLNRVTVGSSISIYPRKMNTYVHIETCTQIFIATLFIIAQKWKVPNVHQSLSGYVNVLCAYNEHYLAMKKMKF